MAQYNQLEINTIRVEVEKGTTLLGLEAILERPHSGIVQKLRKLYNSNPTEWSHEVLLRYEKEYNSLRIEQLRRSHRNYARNHVDEIRIYNQSPARKSQRAKYREENKDKIQKYQAEWRKRNRDYINQYERTLRKNKKLEMLQKVNENPL